jgi:EAL domain-containing protein (putative c-di-GMP-specific phosphodiesterase class I)
MNAKKELKMKSEKFLLFLLFPSEGYYMSEYKPSKFYGNNPTFICYSLIKKDEKMIGGIGIAIYPDDGEELNILIKNADLAMYEAKEKGKGRFEFFKNELFEKVKNKAELTHDLIEAIKKEEFEIYFQPKITKNETLYGAEVLVRWNHPKRGFLSPISFLSIAYEKNLITEIDFIVLKKAVKQYKKWEKKGLYLGKISCNITPIDLEKDDFLNKIKTLLKENDFDGSNLILEVTEQSIMKDPQKSIKFLEELRKLNIGISVDDFGIGYSSLSYLKKLPITEVKIDMSFVKDIGKNKDNEEIIKIIILLAKVLNLKVVAEGVENKQQKEFLIESGVDIIQGYLYSPPISADEFEEKFLKDNK